MQLFILFYYELVYDVVVCCNTHLNDFDGANRTFLSQAVVYKGTFTQVTIDLKNHNLKS